MTAAADSISGRPVPPAGGAEADPAAASATAAGIPITETPTAETPTAAKTPTAVWIALAAVYLIWGSTYVAIRYTIESVPPLISGALRFTVAGLLLAGFLAVKKGPAALRVTRRQAGSAALFGVLLLLVGNGGVVLSEQSIPSGLAALLVAAVPLWVVVWQAVAKVRPNKVALLGVLLGFAGLAVLVLPGGGQHARPGHSFLPGVILVVVAAMSWSFGSVAAKVWLGLPEDPFVASAYEMVFGGIAMGIAAILHGERLHPSALTGKSLIALAYLVVAGSLIGFIAYVWLLHTAPISLVATYAYVNPVVAVALGALFLHEAVTATVVVGGLTVVAAVALVVATERR